MNGCRVERVGRTYLKCARYFVILCVKYVVVVKGQKEGLRSSQKRSRDKVQSEDIKPSSTSEVTRSKSRVTKGTSC